jgi:hypothetical protein
MSRGNSGDCSTGQIPEDQVDRILIKQLKYQVEQLQSRLDRIRQQIEEVYPVFKTIKAPEDNMVQWLLTEK